MGLVRDAYVVSDGIVGEKESGTVVGSSNLGFVGYLHLTQQSSVPVTRRRAVASALNGVLRKADYFGEALLATVPGFCPATIHG